MYNPITIANYFIKRYSQDDNSLTPMKLIKLSYISYGWYLAMSNGEKLISEKPEAWDLGPVMPTLYHNLKKYGGKKVSEPISDNLVSETISDKDAKFLDFIWKKYQNFTGIQLSAITHTEGSPWSEIYPRGYNLVIPDELIKKHYDVKLSEALEIAKSNKEPQVQ